MKKFIHVLEGKVVSRYESQNAMVFGGPWGAGESHEVPEEIKLEYAELEDGVVVEKLPADYYKLQRATEYPSMADYLDGVVKSHSDDQDIHNEGVAQIEKYLADCLAVKAKYPKPAGE